MPDVSERRTHAAPISEQLTDNTTLPKDLRYATLLLRIAIGAGLLSAVADRFGLWGAPGRPSVAWGTFGRFLAYTAALNPWCPTSLLPALGWLVTIAELGLGMALLVNFRLRLTAQLTALITAAFAITMACTLGIHTPLNYSVFAFSAGSYLLSAVSGTRLRQ
jgi:uncharacterized membrane protein YphA (DoxX/SURF4 family)